MKSDFKLKGLSKQKSATCEPLDNENIFWPEVRITQERFDEVFNNFGDTMVAEIMHKGINPDGTPIEGVLVGIREWDI